jgi:2,3-bisphosphoglycerate-independent phosphoglycerate mutase
MGGDRRQESGERREGGPVILIFVDGLGWGGEDPAVNPCHAYGGRLFRLPAVTGEESPPLPVFLDGLGKPLDAVLGVPGLPQSATGQTTLLTGVNAQALLGHHLTGFPNARLRAVLLEGSVLKRVAERGRRAAFLNAFRPLFFKLPREAQLRMSATTVANLAADLPFFRLEDVTARRCLYQEFTNRDLRERGFDVPLFTPAEAGEVLARASRDYDFVLFEYFQTDRAGHARDRSHACRELRKLEEFTERLLRDLGLDGGSAATGGPLVVLTSDHGNLEDLSTRTHTLNPVPFLAWGGGAADLLMEVRDLQDVTPALLRRAAPAGDRPVPRPGGGRRR